MAKGKKTPKGKKAIKPMSKSTKKRPVKAY